MPVSAPIIEEYASFTQPIIDHYASVETALEHFGSHFRNTLRAHKRPALPFTLAYGEALTDMLYCEFTDRDCPHLKEESA